MSKSKTIRVGMLARVEGEGALHIDIDDGEIGKLQLNIFEPPRFFEAFLRGRHYSEVPDIVARICGICPVAYQMSAVHALESAFGVEVEPEIRSLRRLLYCGEWIESHALHIYMLHAPDFLGFPSALELAGEAPEVVRRGLRLKKAGDAILATLGGRAVHPVSVRVGGFSRVPKRDELLALRDELAWSREASAETVRWAATLDFPDFERPYRYAALREAAQYPMNGGDIALGDGAGAPHTLPVADYEQHFKEEHVAHSHALQSRVDGEPYHVGPLARLNLNRDRLRPAAAELLAELGLAWPVTNPFRAIVARAVELFDAVDEALEIVEGYRPPAQPFVTPKRTAGESQWATEAPRGLLYHRYRIDSDGLVAAANIVPPTSQNQTQMEEDMRALLPPIIERPEAEIAAACERLIRCYDPCISCATHFLKLDIRRR